MREGAVPLSAFIREGVALAFCALDRPEREPLSGLSRAERALVEAAESPRRRAELSAGRRAARAALRLLLARDSTPDVLHDADGRPLLSPPQTDLHLSLAHDGGWALAAASAHPLGVDLLPPDRFPQVEAVVRHRLRKRGAQGMPPHAPCPWPDEALLWTAWEALGKRSGRGVLPSVERPFSAPFFDGAGWRAEAKESEREGRAASLLWWAERGLLVCLAR